jgi:hypothetical protein
MANLVSDETLDELYRAQQAGVDTGVDPDTLQALFDKRRMEHALATTQRNGLGATPDDYTQTNHGLDALAPIQNEGG